MTKKPIVVQSEVRIISRRQVQIAQAAAAGECRKVTADRLRLSLESIKSIRRALLRNMGARTITEACAELAKAGLL